MPYISEKPTRPAECRHLHPWIFKKLRSLHFRGPYTLSLYVVGLFPRAERHSNTKWRILVAQLRHFVRVADGTLIVSGGDTKQACLLHSTRGSKTGCLLFSKVEACSWLCAGCRQVFFMRPNNMFTLQPHMLQHVWAQERPILTKVSWL